MRGTGRKVAFTTGRGGYGLDSHYGEPAVGQESLTYCMVMYGKSQPKFGGISTKQQMYGNFQGFPQKAGRSFVNDSATAILYGEKEKH